MNFIRTSPSAVEGMPVGVRSRRLYAHGAQAVCRKNDNEPNAGEAILMLVQAETFMFELRRMQHV